MKFLTIEIADQFKSAEAGTVSNVNQVGNRCTITVSFVADLIYGLEEYTYLQCFGVKTSGISAEYSPLARSLGPLWVEKIEALGSSVYNITIYTPESTTTAFPVVTSPSFPGRVLIHSSLILPDDYTTTVSQRINEPLGDVTTTDGFTFALQRIEIPDGETIAETRKARFKFLYDTLDSESVGISYVETAYFDSLPQVSNFGGYLGNEFVYILGSTTPATAPAVSPFPAVTGATSASIVRAVGGSDQLKVDYNTLLRLGEQPITAVRVKAWIIDTDSDFYRQCVINSRTLVFDGTIENLQVANGLSSTTFQTSSNALDIRLRNTVASISIERDFNAGADQDIIWINQNTPIASIKWVNYQDVAFKVRPLGSVVQDLPDGTYQIPYLINFQAGISPLQFVADPAVKADAIMLKPVGLEEAVKWNFAVNFINPRLAPVPLFNDSRLGRFTPVSGVYLQSVKDTLKFDNFFKLNRLATGEKVSFCHVFESVRTGSRQLGVNWFPEGQRRYHQITPAEVVTQVLLSTGTSVGRAGINSDGIMNPGDQGIYDVLPESVGLGIDISLVDTFSFLDIMQRQEDQGIFLENLAIVGDETKMYDFLQKNCLRPFGLVLSTRRDGKITLRQIDVSLISTFGVTGFPNVIDFNDLRTDIGGTPDVSYSRVSKNTYSSIRLTNKPAHLPETIESNITTQVPYITEEGEFFNDPALITKKGVQAETMELKGTLAGTPSVSGALPASVASFLVNVYGFLTEPVQVSATVSGTAIEEYIVGDVCVINVIPDNFREDDLASESVRQIYGVITSIKYDFRDETADIVVVGIPLNIDFRQYWWAPSFEVDTVTGATLFTVTNTFGTNSANPDFPTDLSTIDPLTGLSLLLFDKNWVLKSTVAPGILSSYNVDTGDVILASSFSDGSPITPVAGDIIILDDTTNSSDPVIEIERRFVYLTQRAF